MTDKLNIFSEPHMPPGQVRFFSECISKCKNYFEFGMGGSTMTALCRGNCEIKSVESDFEFYKTVKQICENRFENIDNKIYELRNEVKKLENEISNSHLDGLSCYENIENYIKLVDIKKIREKIELFENKKKISTQNSNIKLNYIDINSDPNNWGRPSDDTKKDNWEKYPKTILEYDEVFDLILVDGRFRVACALCSLYRMDENSILLFDDYVKRKEYHIVEQFFNKIDDNMVVFKKKSNIDFKKVDELIEKYKNIHT